MVKQKQIQLSKVDVTLFAAGLISTTLVAAFVANGLFKGHVWLLLAEAVMYVAIVAMYIQAFRTSRTASLIQFTRIVSYSGIIVAILIASFIAYFVSTFRW